MSDLSFNKNRFIKSNPAILSKPIVNDPNKLGRRTIEEIKTDMHTLNKPKPEVKKQNIDLQKNNPFRPFNNWGKK